MNIPINVRTLAFAAIVVIMVLLIARRSRAAGIPNESRMVIAFNDMLPAIPGKRVSVVRIDYPPGGRTAPHHHSVGVFAYVLSGAVRSENSATGPARVYQAGETFFEPAGSTQLVSENASETAQASFLVMFVSDDGASQSAER
jgi:quercetin dioxygenase-like cupin family protein